MGLWRKADMRRLRQSAVIFLVAYGSCYACFYPPESGPRAPGQKAPKASSAFVHKIHEKVLEQNEFKCTDCHLYDLAYMSRDKEINEEITRALTRAGMESCHFCHREHPERTKVSLKCLDCHRDIQPLRPQNHRAGWRDSHGNGIAENDVACSQCHSNRFCVQCHARREEANRAYHTGSALLSHPIQARADPTKCRKCHQAAYCTRCHKFGRF